jgi:hypothetical protein
MYLTIDEYKELSGKITDKNVLNKFLKQSERYIDILTYNRIKSIGFENCSDFEKEIIKEVQSEIIDFYNSNQDMINSYLNSYSINGVNMSFGDTNNNILTVNGITILKSSYNKLNTTRFTSLIL